MKNPWQIKSQENKYENPWVRMIEYGVVTPGGKDGIYGVLELKQRGNAIIPLDEENNTWLVGEYNFVLNDYKWGIPAGGTALGEATPLEAAREELEQETGITAKKWDKIMDLHPDYGVMRSEVNIFLARDLSFGEGDYSTEQLQVRKVSFEDAVTMVRLGEITSGIAVSAILRLNDMIQNGEI